ncbi:MAG: formate--tetrahydrofolate ligase [Deltaproteobacteria bacterium]|nr:MAG: formate--tetrahydrofolate ligase [Deltaproteobacteria bacterium]
MRSIHDIAARLGLSADDVIPYGRDKAKLPLSLLERPSERAGKLVLVSAITPTPAGEGKTTTSIGLAQALDRLGHRTIVALREPSLGPCFGVKGGGTGGGQSRLVPTAEINLHFTGDLHAVTSAHNLIAALVDNHLHFELSPRIDSRRVVWPRVLDVNDRSLRDLVVGLGGRTQGVPRQTSFDITAASEVMAVLCLAKDEADLRARLARTVVAFDYDLCPVTVDDIGGTGAVMALLRDALMPNLVQTVEGTPAIVHGGPFANIAHGCNSVLATRMALHHADWVVTEAGFGMDLGGEKFLDIKCRTAGLSPTVVVLVATVRALKLHGGQPLKELANEDVDALRRGLPNLEKHLETVARFGLPAVVAINRFASDTDAEIAALQEVCAKAGATCALSTHFADGGAGAEALAEAVLASADPNAQVKPLYELSDTIRDKVRKVAKAAYGARDVVFTSPALRGMKRLKELGYGELPVCLAKTQASLSDDPDKLGRPEDFAITVREVRLNAGAGFLVVLTGKITRMPGLPRVPAAGGIDVVDGEIVGVG